jgi:hypothetical protein
MEESFDDCSSEDEAVQIIKPFMYEPTNSNCNTDSEGSVSSDDEPGVLPVNTNWYITIIILFVDNA